MMGVMGDRPDHTDPMDAVEIEVPGPVQFPLVMLVDAKRIRDEAVEAERQRWLGDLEKAGDAYETLRELALDVTGAWDNDFAPEVAQVGLADALVALRRFFDDEQEEPDGGHH